MKTLFLLLFPFVSMCFVGCKNSRYDIIQVEDIKKQIFSTMIIDTKLKDSVIACWVMWDMIANDDMRKHAYYDAKLLIDRIVNGGGSIPKNYDTVENNMYQNIRIR